ncbi:MAG: ERAP1-like C-terminal domain-containing protein, partial [Thermoplasmata archaeon]
DFWLNESFASFMQARIDAELYPGLDTESDFLLTLPRWGLRGDALRQTHPVEVPVRSATELGEIADEITYGKGAGVLRMIEAYLGEPVFREGVRRYLNRFAYANARSEDLWAALEAAADAPVGRIMAAWVRQPGYPVLTVRAVGDRLQLAQRRFLLDGSREPGLWPVPVTVELDGRRDRHLMEAATLEIPRAGARAVRINPGRTGFYRVLYDEPLGEEIRAQYAAMADVDRWGLLTDAYAFLLSGDLPTAPYLELLREAALQPTPLTAGEVVFSFLEIAPLLGPVNGLREGFRGYFQTALDRIGPGPVDGEGEAIGGVRGSLAVARARIDPEYARTLGARFPSLDSVPGDLRTAVVEAYGATAGAEAVAELTGLMFGAPTEEVARQMAGGLARRERPEELRAVLDLALDPRMPTSRARTLIGAAAATRSSPGTVWRWLADHLPELDRLMEGTPLLSSLLEGALPLLGPTREAEVRAHFAAAAYPSAERGIRKGLERMGILAAFLRRSTL